MGLKMEGSGQGFSAKKFGAFDSGTDKSVMDDPFIDYVLGENYRIIELIGSGGWGNVYRAKDICTDNDVAIKILHKHHLQDDMSVKRLEQEADALSKLKSQSIVQVIDYGLSPAPYIVMEYFDGMPLAKYLKDHGAMHYTVAIDLFVQLCDGLGAAESISMVHRDLKPANILVNSIGRHTRAKILDFGLVKFLDESNKLTATGEIMGSPPYMPPEQWKGQCDLRSDIYSLGCIMYEVLTGTLAFNATFGMDYLYKHMNEDPERFAQRVPGNDIPESLEMIVRKCVQKAPENRYQSAMEIRRDLQKIKTGRQTTVVLPEERKKKSAKNASKSLILVSTAFVAALAVVFFFREPVMELAIRNFNEEADKALGLGQTDEAISKYRQTLFLSQFLSNNGQSRLHALRMLATLLSERKEYTSASSIEKQILELSSKSTEYDGNAELSQALKEIEERQLAKAGRNGSTALAAAVSVKGNKGAGSQQVEKAVSWKEPEGIATQAKSKAQEQPKQEQSQRQNEAGSKVAVNPENNKLVAKKDPEKELNENVEMVRAEIEKLKVQGRGRSLDSANAWKKMGKYYFDAASLDGKYLRYAEASYQQAYSLEESLNLKDADTVSNLNRIKISLGKTDSLVAVSSSSSSKSSARPVREPARSSSYLNNSQLSAGAQALSSTLTGLLSSEDSIKGLMSSMARQRYGEIGPVPGPYESDRMLIAAVLMQKENYGQDVSAYLPMCKSLNDAARKGDKTAVAAQVSDAFKTLGITQAMVTEWRTRNNQSGRGRNFFR